MIGYLHGLLMERRTLNTITVICGGVGYEVIVNDMSLPVTDEGGEIPLWIWHVQTDRGQYLYGFEDVDERDLARTLAKIQGIGPAKASRVLHKLSWVGFTRLVEGNDAKALAAECPGIGPATAKKIIDYWVQFEDDAPEEMGVLKDAVSIIRALGLKLNREILEDVGGYSPTTAEEAAQKYLELYRESE